MEDSSLSLLSVMGKSGNGEDTCSQFETRVRPEWGLRWVDEDDQEGGVVGASGRPL